ncbi:AraC family transcriptional regulator [Flagellimonas olearia]|nr:AraC family transcriptional regulator [Allomuricauda olearia]
MEQKAKTYLELLQEAYRKGDYHLHRQYSDSLFVYAQERGLGIMQVKALVNQAIGDNIQGDYQRAISLYQKALEVCKTIPGDVHHQTLVLVNLANTYSNVDLHDKAIATMEQVLEQADRTEKPDLMRVAALNGLSKSHSYLGKEEEALVYAEKVKELGNQMKNENIVLTGINHISNSHYKLGDYEKAVHVAKQAFGYEAFKRPTKTRAWILINLGTAYLKLRDFTNAKIYLDQALQIAEDQNINEIQIVCYENLIEVYKSIGNSGEMVKMERLYANAKINSLDNEKAAVESDLRAEINDKQRTISEQEELMDMFNVYQNKMIWMVLLSIILFGALSWTYIRIKRDIKLESERSKDIAVPFGDVENEEFIMQQEKYRNSSLSESDRARYKEKVLELMEEDKPYLDTNLMLGDFARKASMSSHHLSEVLHFGFEKNFYGFINYYRVIHAQALLKDPKNNNVKMLAIAFESGFQSKTTFYRVFKAQVGVTPMEYRKQNRL